MRACAVCMVGCNRFSLYDAFALTRLERVCVGMQDLRRRMVKSLDVRDPG